MVMHARKPQRVNDGYFEKHQTHPYQSSKYSKRDYERETSRSAFIRDRDISPGGGPLNNGTNSYIRTDSPDLDSPREKDRDRDRDRYQSSTYLQKMREKAERERDSYSKKDKYGTECLRSPKDKLRDRRAGGSDRDLEHRTNHDRSDLSRRTIKLCSQISGDKRGGSSSNSDDRDHRERDRDRDRNDRDRDRGERVIRIGDWSEHVSSSGKKYYYNCKTEISQWEKPREWLEKERNLHREYREKERDRDRDREERFSTRSSYKHSNSRGSSRIRWSHDTDMVPATSSSSHSRRRHENDSQDMDISPGDSTPTSEASYSHSSTPTTIQNNNNINNDCPVLLATALPRLASHPSTPTNSQLHFTTPASTSLNTTSCTTTSLLNQQNSGSNLSGVGSNLSHQISKLNKNDSMHINLPTSSPSTPGILGGSITVNTIQNENMLNSNTPGPPPVTLANLPKILSQITGNKTIDQNELNPQKALQTINNALLMSSRQQQQHGNESNHNSGANSLREHTLNSPLYNLSHIHSMSMINHSGGSPYMSGTGNNSMIISDGPPTPTQELDVNEHRKLEGTSASLSSLQGVSSQGSRSQGPSLTPSLANYLRADLIAHVTAWPAEMLEKQTIKCSDEAHLLGDLQCTRVSAELKIARSLVRITEITATLQEQKVMYLRQQIRRLEELKSQNSFMSDDL